MSTINQYKLCLYYYNFQTKFHKMNIYNLKEQLQAAEQIGCAFDAPQRMKLEMGLLRLTQLANADQLLFWGKVTTMAQPYYIAVAVDFKGHYAFPKKRFFYSGQNFNFQQLPSLDQCNKNQAQKFNHMPFTGNPAHILVNVAGQGQQKKQQAQKKQEQVDSDQDEAAVKIVQKNFTELDRLGYTVRAIQIQCQLIPVGAVRMNQQHELRYNEYYKQYSIEDIQFGCFQHFRYPQNQEAKKVLQSADSIFQKKLLDKIENLSFWSIQANTKQSIVTVRSLFWPGYLAYMFLNKPAYGGLYIGNGIKTVDLPFYI